VPWESWRMLGDLRCYLPLSVVQAPGTLKPLSPYLSLTEDSRSEKLRQRLFLLAAPKTTPLSAASFFDSQLLSFRPVMVLNQTWYWLFHPANGYVHRLPPWTGRKRKTKNLQKQYSKANGLWFPDILQPIYTQDWRTPWRSQPSRVFIARSRPFDSSTVDE